MKVEGEKTLHISGRAQTESHPSQGLYLQRTDNYGSSQAPRRIRTRYLSVQTIQDACDHSHRLFIYFLSVTDVGWSHLRAIAQLRIRSVVEWEQIE
jgi:hypothetical protein